MPNTALVELVRHNRRVLVHMEPTSSQEKEITDKEMKRSDGTRNNCARLTLDKVVREGLSQAGRLS